MISCHNLLLLSALAFSMFQLFHNIIHGHHPTKNLMPKQARVAGSNQKSCEFMRDEFWRNRLST